MTKSKRKNNKNKISPHIKKLETKEENQGEEQQEIINDIDINDN